MTSARDVGPEAGRRLAALGAPLLLAALLAAPAAAQHGGHHPTPPPPEPVAEAEAPRPEPAAEPTDAHQDPHAGHAPGHDDAAPMAMPGFFGPYPMSRESSGTSWQPEAAPMHALHGTAGDWMLMAHGFANAIFSDQGGPRGDSDLFVTSMVMGMGSRPWAGGTLGARAMLSADPALVGKDGYPLLFQTGETADGVRPLVDRQHPHDLFMELAGSYSRPFGERSSWFVYGGLPGEPALGPPTFMHRFSGVDHPEAPLGHHWLDSTHITFGVVTGGVVLDRWKLDASLFNGREPDEERYDLELRPLRSESLRVSFNPSERWSLQASRGWLDSPEQLAPGVDVERTTASILHHRASAQSQWQTMLAWGRNEEGDEAPTDAWLLDSAIEIDGRHTVFARLERVENDDLFEEGHPLHHEVFEITKLGLGYLRRWPLRHLLPRARWGVGGLVNQYLSPRELDPIYSSDPVSWVVFARLETP